MRLLLLLVMARAKDLEMKGTLGAPNLEELRAAMKALENAMGGGSCGVVAELRRHQWEPFRGKMLCGTKMATNCSISYHQLRCPEECPFLAPERQFPCQFSCRQETDCSHSNLDLAFPDPVYSLCSQCYVTGCLWCDTLGTCKKCSPGFQLSEDRGTCIFSITADGWANMVMLVLICFLALLILTAMIYCLRGSRNPNADENALNIWLGLRHRHLSKVQDWDLQSKKKPPRERYSLAVDLSKTNVLGVGFALFYRTIIFMLAISVTSALFLWHMSDSSDFVRGAETQPGERLMEELAETSPSKATLPALLLSSMSHCPVMSPLDKTEPLRLYAQNRGRALGLLYVALFGLSAWFVRAQKLWARSFDSKNNSMCDFALLLKGFPSDATNEVELKNWAQAEVNELGLREVEVEGVSVCYNYGDEVANVEDMTERHSTGVELQMRRDCGQSSPAMEEELQKVNKQMEDDGQKVKAWFADGTIKSTGDVFLVFKNNKDKDDVMAKHEQMERQKTGKLFKYRGKDLEVQVLRSEPPDVYWSNLHVSDAEIKSNSRKALVKVMVWFLSINFLVVLWNMFVVMPYMAAGSSAGGPMVMIQGIIMTIINAVFGGQIYGGAMGAGYHRKDLADVWLFFVNFFITFCNTIFNLGLMAYSVLVLQRDDFMRSPGYLDTFSSATPLGQESDVAEKVYLMLVPGQLFTGPVIGLLTGAMLNYILNALFAKMIYVWKCLPDPLLKVIKLILPASPDSLTQYGVKDAQNGMAPPSVGLPWDYSSLLLNPFLVFISFFMISHHGFKLCCYLALACIFSYAWSRFMHLRVQSANFYSTAKLDQVVMVTWGAPLSTLAACAMSWEIRAGNFLRETPLAVRWGAVLGVYVLSVLIWAAVVHLLHPFNGKPDNIADDHNCTFESCKSEWIFSWFNCNPLYTLKCLYYIPSLENWDHPLASGEDPAQVRYYRPGKEFLHFDYQKFPKIMSGDFMDSLEFETYFELVWKVVTKWQKKGKINPDDLAEQLEHLLKTRQRNRDRTPREKSPGI